MTGFTVTPEAVEAAARGMFAEESCDKRQRENLEENWNSRLNDEDQAEYRALARAALEAAARTAQPAATLDREAVLAALREQGVGAWSLTTPASIENHLSEIADAILALGPQPQLTATREKLTEVLGEHRLIGIKCRCGFDARLDYHRFEKHQADALLASGVVQEASVPVVDRDLMVETLTRLRIDGTTGSAVIEESEAEFIAENLAQAGVFKTEAEVRVMGAEEVRAIFNRMWSSGDWDGQVSIGFAATFDQEIDEAAAAIRAGGQ